MKRTTRHVAALLAGIGLGLGLLTGVSCVSPAGDVPQGADTRSVVSNAGTWRIAFRTEPETVPLNRPFRLVARVFEAGVPGRERTDVSLRVDASMPQHRHGMNHEPRHALERDGSVLVEGLLFHMPGEWTLTFDVTHGAITERAEIVVEPR